MAQQLDRYLFERLCIGVTLSPSSLPPPLPSKPISETIPNSDFSIKKKKKNAFHRTDRSKKSLNSKTRAKNSYHFTPEQYK